MKSALELSAKYGKPWESPEALAAFENQNMTQWRSNIWNDKYGYRWAGFFDLDKTIPFKSLYCNREIIKKLDLTFMALAHRDVLREIKTFDGCFNVRKIRGREANPYPEAWSIHSFGLALDFNASEMPLGSESKWSPEFVAVWRALGWTWGGDFERRDCMHMEFTDL